MGDSSENFWKVDLREQGNMHFVHGKGRYRIPTNNNWESLVNGIQNPAL